MISILNSKELRKLTGGDAIAVLLQEPLSTAYEPMFIPPMVYQKIEGIYTSVDRSWEDNWLSPR